MREKKEEFTRICASVAVKEIEGLTPETKIFSIREKNGIMWWRREGWGMWQETGEGSSLRAAEFEVMNEH